jgi:hypothetical protein
LSMSVKCSEATIATLSQPLKNQSRSIKEIVYQTRRVYRPDRPIALTISKTRLRTRGSVMR